MEFVKEGMTWLAELFNSSGFVVVGGVSTVVVLIGMIYVAYLYLSGILPVLQRIGMGLAKREIAIYADADNFANLKNTLVDSKIIKEKNIMHVDMNSLKKGENATLKLVHWKSSKKRFDEILNLKKDTDALIVYAPRNEGELDNKHMKTIANARNIMLVNFRGRLLNDILGAMMMTSYK
jgi:hypothetical protein